MEQWIELKGTSSASFIKFDTPGVVVVGMLKNKETSEDFGTTIYTVETEEGTFKFFGSVVLDRYLSKVKLGDSVKIEYLGTRKSERTRRTYKDFNVFKKEVVAD